MLCKLCTVCSWEATLTSRTSTSGLWTSWGRVAIDITAKHPKSRNCYEYVLTVVDYVTKWAKANPIRDHKATTVARVLLENCFRRLGMPEDVISDHGAEFEGKLFTGLCKSVNVSKLRTISYRPLINEMVERYHRTFNQMSGKVVGEIQRDFDLHVPAAAARVHVEFHDARLRSSSGGGHRSRSTGR